jgi:dTDP-4-dehydrorhamnose reductase
MNQSEGDKPLVWITGAGGLIGHALLKTCPQAWTPRGLGRDELDLLDPAAVERAFRQERPTVIIHCAAISKNPLCQANPSLARQVNTQATKLLSELALEIPFIFFSTDLVFDGEKGNYLEVDAPNPLSVYAETKVAAEECVLKNPHHTILRISLNGGVSPTRDRGFNEEMYRAWGEGKTLSLFIDEYRCPMAAVVTAKAAWELVRAKAGGIYHLCGSEKLSRFEIGELLARKHPELNPRITPGSRKDYNGPPRPKDTSLHCAKVQQILSFRLPRFSDWIAQCAPNEF